MSSSDDDLVKQVILNGNREAFGELARRHQASIRSSLNHLARDPMLAEDLAQDTFIRAYDRIAQYRLGESFRAWLGGIAYKEFLKTMRSQRSAVKHMELYANSMAQSDEGRDDAAFGAIDLGQALAILSDNERSSVVLCCGLGMSHAETSIAMDAPLGTVKSWVQRGKAKMRDALESYDDGIDNE